MTRQMLSAVSSGRMPLWRSTSRRIISASRAGRKAEPDLQRLLHFDQTIDDLAALHQQVMHRLIKAIYLLPQSWERIGNRRVSSRPGALRTQPRGIDR